MSDKEIKKGLQSTELATSIADALEGRRSFLRLAAGAGTAIGVGGLLVACGGGGEDGLVRETPKTEAEPIIVCAPKEVTLWAGQTMNWGTLTIFNDADFLYVKYTLKEGAPEGACLEELHLWVGDDLTNMPAAPGNGAPINGQFPYKYDPEECLTEHEFKIPKADLLASVPSTYCGKTFYVVAHASGGNETMYGGDKPVNVKDKRRWWWYTEYTWCCPNPGPDDEMICQTAFAKGNSKSDTYVFTTDGKKSNPEGLSSLMLIKNRWGWAIKLAAPTIEAQSYDIWAGAGLNNTANGLKVGSLVVEWTGQTATVRYQLTGANCLQEVHLYASDTMPTTTAPGQYGITEYYLDGCTKSDSFSVDVVDPAGDGIWLIAHAVVCYPKPTN